MSKAVIVVMYASFYYFAIDFHKNQVIQIMYNFFTINYALFKVQILFWALKNIVINLVS